MTTPSQSLLVTLIEQAIADAEADSGNTDLTEAILREQFATAADLWRLDGGIELLHKLLQHEIRRRCYMTVAARVVPAISFEDLANDRSPILGCCPHGVDLDREFCPDGCRV